METTASLPTVSPSFAEQRTRRSAVTNGSRLFVKRPGDTAWSRRFRDILDLILADVAAGRGAASLTEGQRQLARRAATLCIACETLEGQAAAGEVVNWDTYGQMSDRLGRAFHRLGLKREAVDAPQGTWSAAYAHERRQQQNPTHD